MDARGWSELDIIIVTGDAYVDHPSYGAAVIGRYLESSGFKVGVIAQPDWRTADDFKKLGRPRLFFGITSGNVDSMIANYSANKVRRKSDDFSPGAISGMRPDRSVIAYTAKAREAFPGVTVVLGGVEASLRRFAHYDHWDDAVRRSMLVDAKADILVYGMGEKPVLEVARRMSAGGKAADINNVRGTAVIRKDLSFLKEFVEVPSFEEVKDDREKFNEAFRTIYREQDPSTAKPVVQKHADRFVVQFPPAEPFSEKEMDEVFDLPYAYAWHPVYSKAGGIKAFETVRFSIISHRGCCAECSFCGIHTHQGRIVQSRSAASILREAKRITDRPDFRGTITDIGGPTANMYAAKCRKWQAHGFCGNKSCLVPEKCKNLVLGYDESMRLYDGVKCLPKVKHVFVSSGFRYDLLNDRYSDKYLEKICREHISGQMKVAPEHVVDRVLRLMNKPPHRNYERFVRRIEEINGRSEKKTYLVNYFISAHPGSTLRDALDFAVYLAKRKMHPEQVQDFIPLPMTLSACMYHTGKDPFTGEKVYAPRSAEERRMQRALIQYNNPANAALVEKALAMLGAKHLKGLLCAEGASGTRTARFRGERLRKTGQRKTKRK